MCLFIPSKFCDASFCPTYGENYDGFPLNVPLRFPLNVPHTNSNFDPNFVQNRPVSSKFGWIGHKITKMMPKSHFGRYFQNFIFDHYPPKFDPLRCISAFWGLSFRNFQIHPEICYHMKNKQITYHLKKNWSVPQIVTSILCAHTL